jgi:hypothetical protein
MGTTFVSNFLSQLVRRGRGIHFIILAEIGGGRPNRTVDDILWRPLVDFRVRTGVRLFQRRPLKIQVGRHLKWVGTGPFLLRSLPRYPS